MLLLAIQLLKWQLAMIIVISIVFAGLIAANITLVCLFIREKKKPVRRSGLATPKLQKQRDELLGQLENLSRK